MTLRYHRHTIFLALTIFGIAIVGFPLSASDVDESIERRATNFAHALIEGRIEDSRRDFSPEMKSALPAAEVARLIPTLASQLGEFAEFGERRRGCFGDHPTVWQRLSFARGELDMRISFDWDNRVAGVWFTAPETATSCPAGSDKPEENSTAAGQSGIQATNAPKTSSRPALPTGAIEKAITVGAGGWPLDGWLVLPPGEGPFPIVVLVHGSGPHDADETIFANTPFRDLADGLVREGVASLRYVKRTRAHGDRLVRERANYTVDDEVIDDAVAAIEAARATPLVDRERVYVIGHSLGGMLAPCIAAAEPSVAGLVLLAGPSRSLEDLAMEQMEYLASRSGTDSRSSDWQERFERVKRLSSGESAEGPLLFDLPASYWHSLRRCDPLVTARRVNKPMLVLQGERDYQVTMTDFEGWRAGLQGRHDVTLRSFPELDHLFIAGEGPSMPADYLRAGTMDNRVIRAIAGWIAGLQGGTQ